MTAWNEYRPLVAELLPERPRRGPVHLLGTDTEYEAANANREARGTQRQRVLGRLRDCGESGSTDYEMYLALELRRPHIAGTRREELIADGWPIVDSGRRRKTDTGRNAIVWTLREADGSPAMPESSASRSDPEGGLDAERLGLGVSPDKSSAQLAPGARVSPSSPSSPERVPSSLSEPDQANSRYSNGLDSGAAAASGSSGSLSEQRSLFDSRRSPEWA